MVQKKSPPRKNKKFPGLRMPAQPGSQPAAGRSMGRPASRPGSRAAAQPGRQATFGLASEQPAGRRASPLARRAARQLPARGQPVQTPENIRLFFYTGIRHFSETVIPKQPDPGRKKSSGKAQPRSWLAGMSATAASRQANRLSSQQLASEPASKLDDRPGPQTADRLARQQPSDQLASRIFHLELVGVYRGRCLFLFFIWPETPETTFNRTAPYIYIYIYIPVYRVPGHKSAIAAHREKGPLGIPEFSPCRSGP